ncbi:bacterial extracellular solute-binding, 7 family protein [Lyngbya aestuarii BL J]|uniref:Bacterial extracellular solute-binding, 7 family protein n=1 Tax=Lyngbya aestuarii BL J TaxID=1348334 RepID=U7QNW7_9CYAN|nr:TRAP transporter substrate-binding protein [Lyngbya aestuarii]ERT08947.1 bacterial extracellular solute-binding, 7 family protein [Lyngbya aestuarii BL J]
MKRRHLLNSITTGGATTATLAALTHPTSVAVEAQSQPQIRWKMTTSWPTSLDTLYGAAQTVARRVSEMTDGRFTIQVFAAGEIVPGLQVLDAVQQGTVECGHSASYYYIGKNPALAFGTAVPFGLNAQQQNAWLYKGGGNEALNQIYADFNTIAFPAGNTGVQMGGWFKREINTVADLQGLKMRIPGLGGEVLSRLGVNVQVLPGGEIFLALERGAIDAAEFAGPYDDERLGLNNAAKFYYYPGWWEAGPSLHLLVNLMAWKKLPKVYQEILKTSAIEANMECLAKYEAQNPKALNLLIKNGAELRTFSPEILEAAQKISVELFQDKSAESQSFQQTYQPWKKFRDAVFTWNAVGELAYNNWVIANSKLEIDQK